MIKRSCQAALLCLAALSACAGPAQTGGAGAPTCDVRRLTEVPVETAGDRLIVPVSVNEVAFEFMLDTGADSAILSRQTVSRLGLKLDPEQKVKLDALGGEISLDQATVTSMKVGDLSLPVRAVGVGDPLEPTIEGRTIGGILGADFFTRFDVDLDVPNGRMTVYSVHHCKGAFVPWQPPFDTLAARWLFSFSQLAIPVRLDGRPVSAIVDTGAPYTLVSQRSVAQQVGIPAAALQADQALGFGYGLDRHRQRLRLHKFNTVSIGSIALQDVSLPMLDTKMLDADLLIGLSFVQKHRIWFSPSTTQVFIAR